MDRLAFIDVGELGWSLALSAYIRWLKRNAYSKIAVISFPDRRCLHEGIADHVIDVPDVFGKKYNLQFQDCFRLRYVGWNELKAFFLPYIPKGYRIPDYKEYPHYIFSNNRIYEPYKYSKPPENGGEIMVFPRYRPGVRRNLPRSFYLSLIKQLCNEFPKLRVRTIGTIDGAYNMKTKYIDKPNYLNWVGMDEDIQDMINKCQSAVVAVGGQSGPLKISLLQGVPTFIIGHQQTRHTKEENWMNTKVGFYEIEKRGYAKINVDKCINEAVAFVREAQ